MLSSCKRCLIVMPFSEQWLSIDWISSNVIICVLFNAKVARINPGYKMHFFGGLHIAQYIMYYLQSPTFLEIFNSNKNGIIGGVSVNNLKQLIIPLPPFCEIKRIEKCVNQLFKSIEV